MSKISATTHVQVLCDCNNMVNIGPIFNRVKNTRRCSVCNIEHAVIVAVDHVATQNTAIYTNKVDAEEARVEVLHNLNILDTPSEERFDRITKLAKIFFKVPIALITLIDTDRQWFKSNQGLEGVCETARKTSFCTHTIKGIDVMVIPDSLADERFRDNPYVVGEPHVRFYAGAPLIVNDQRLGSLCIIDMKPHEFSEHNVKALRDLAHCVEDELKRAPLQ